MFLRNLQQRAATNSMAMRRSITEKKQVFGNFSRRAYQYYGSKEYATGFERMVLDKFNAVRILPKISWFALLGGINLACYGLSLMMSPEDYLYYFAYRGTGRYTDMLRSFVGSNVLGNAIWTGPGLILAGQYMHSKVGAMTMLKFTPMALLATMAFYTAFSPNPNQSLFPNFAFGAAMMPHICAHGTTYYMGADSIASAVIYFALMYHRLWTPCLALTCVDLFYYGPMCLGGPLAGIFAGLTLV